jgi:hypothetical protein
MNVARVLSHLRSELKEIEQEIRLLEGSNGPVPEQQDERRNSMTEIKLVETLCHPPIRPTS